MTKENIKKVLLLLAVFGIFALIANALLGSWTSYDIKHYKELTETNTILPKLDELGDYEDIDFKFYRKNMLIFQSDAYTLKVAYDENNYNIQKEKINQEYIFHEEPISDDRSGISYVKKSAFTIDDFDMRVLSEEAYKMHFPKNIIFIGTSDEKRMISYVYYFDDDLDYIDTSLEDFLKSE
ncbi:MAG: hypothetical protein IJO50_01620, partial [Clostridia bacterium]|nr:hypothetical protein [Clostridia bacterium]